MPSTNVSRKTLYDTETGEAHSFHLVDARECLARGGWSETPPKGKGASKSGETASDTASAEPAGKAETAAKSPEKK